MSAQSSGWIVAFSPSLTLPTSAGLGFSTRCDVQAVPGPPRLAGRQPGMWLRKGLDFAGAWRVCEQNRLLALCFGLPQADIVKIGAEPAHPAPCARVCDM